MIKEFDMLTWLAVGYILGIALTMVVGLIYGNRDEGDWVGPIAVLVWLLLFAVSLGVVVVETVYNVAGW